MTWGDRQADRQTTETDRENSGDRFINSDRQIVWTGSSKVTSSRQCGQIHQTVHRVTSAADLGRTLWSTSVRANCLAWCSAWRSISSRNTSRSWARPLSFRRKVLSVRNGNSARGMLRTGTTTFPGSRVWKRKQRQMGEWLTPLPPLSYLMIRLKISLCLQTWLNKTHSHS